MRIDGWGILCSRNARPRKDLVGRAQGGLPQPSLERELNLRPCLGQGASLGEEAVLADSGWAGEVAAGVGRVKKADRFELPTGSILRNEA